MLGLLVGLLDDKMVCIQKSSNPKHHGGKWLRSENVFLYAAWHSSCCQRERITTPHPKQQKKTALIVLSILSVLCGPSSLFGSQQLSVLERSCSIALVWALGLPWGVWVLQHRTVNPPESWWLLIRYSHPASCPEENSAGLYSLSASSSPSPYSQLHSYQPSCRCNRIQYIMQDTGAASRFSPPFSSTNISPPPFVYLAVWLSSLLPLLLSPRPLSLPLICHFLPVTLPCFTPLFLF